MVAVVIGVPLLASCSESSSTGDSSSTARASDGAASSATQSGAYEEVQFTARDGANRPGRLYGEGPVGIVLSHMGRPDDSQDDWADFATELADRGYLVLTYKGRTVTQRSEWQDVLGGVDYLRDNGAETVIAGGASIGAMASMYAAEQPDSHLHGVIWLAGVQQGGGYSFREADIAAITCPMLFISGDEDAYGAADATRQLHDWATAPTELLILQTSRHGTDIFDEGGRNAAELTQAMVNFVEEVVAQPTAC